MLLKGKNLYILSAAICFMASSCIVPMGKQWGWKPRYLFMSGPEGDNDYTRGWYDGCQTIMSVSSSGAQQFLPAKIDGYKLKNSVYGIGFDDATEHCLYVFEGDLT